jgi:hypothetical protein
MTILRILRRGGIMLGEYVVIFLVSRISRNLSCHPFGQIPEGEKDRSGSDYSFLRMRQRLVREMPRSSAAFDLF